MEKRLPSEFQLSKEVAYALSMKRPIVALESTVITHGLPYPENIKLAQDMESEVRNGGAVPATIAVVNGKIVVGAAPDQIDSLGQTTEIYKISSRDFGAAAALGRSGGTTVAGTMVAAHAVGIQVFATGGIGGVHRQAPGSVARFNFDISADLPQLARTPMIVVCAGAKAILDLAATLEFLETAAVPVVGYQTSEFPAFYSRSSGLKVSAAVSSAEEIAGLARAHWNLGLKSAVLVVNPPPEEVALDAASVENEIQKALADAEAAKISGQEVTPFLLKRVTELTGGSSLKANLGLLLNNARLAAEIAGEMAQGRYQSV